MKVKEKTLKQQLEVLKGEDYLKDYVIDYIVDNYEGNNEIKCFFSDLLQHGCVSGMINSLIYYTDTAKFYDEYYTEIEELRQELEDNGIEIKVNCDLKNFYAWLGFEETARKLVDELELDY